MVDFYAGILPNDTEAPILISSSPTFGATNIAADSNISLNFSEDIQLNPSSSSVIQLTRSTGALVENFAANSPNLSITGTSLLINPSSDLSSGASYNLTIPADFIQ